MPDPTPDDSRPKSRLDQISTRWSTLHDPAQFVLRYAPAVRRYVDALLQNAADAEDVVQEIVLRFVQKGFAGADPVRGRFRDYLKQAVRNAALGRRRKRQAGQEMVDADRVAVTDPAPARADEEWAAEWRRCLLGRAWRALEEHQRRSSGNLAHTVLRIAVEHPDEDSVSQAARAAAEAGQPLTATAYRKQLSRARRIFAELVRAEVAQTLDDPSPEQVEEELAEVGLRKYLRRFLAE